MWQQFLLASKLFNRELYHGDFNLLIIALLIATASLSSIGFLIEHIDRSMTQHANQLNGAQLVLKSSRAVPDSWLKKAQDLSLKQAKMLVFPSMLVRNGDFKLAQIKAISAHFPLSGELLIKYQGIVQSVKAPPPGEIWLDKRLALDFKLHESIELGAGQFDITAVLERIPGQSNALFSIAPSAVINIADLDKTQTILPGSRVDYIYFFSAAKAYTDKLPQFKLWLTSRLHQGQTLHSGVEDLKAVHRSLKKATSYLSLAAMLSLLLAAIAITITCYQYGQQQYKNNAIMLCLGATEQSILRIEIIKILLLAGVAGSLGVAVGYGVFLILLIALGDALSSEPAYFYPLPAMVSLGSGVFLLLMISLANLLRVKKLSPMALIRNELLAAKTISQLLNYKLFYLLIIAGLLLISIVYSGRIKMTLVFYLLLLFSGVCFYLLARFMLQQIIDWGRRRQWLNRLTLLNLERHKALALLQICSFSLIFALLMILFLLRSELLSNWQGQFPAETPNYFVINIAADEQQKMTSYLQQQHIQSQGLYPMIRGRLTEINQQPVNLVISEQARSHNALHRELNLSVGSIPITNKQPYSNSISIESSLAKALSIQRGDVLGFSIGAHTLEGIVSEIREVQWDSFEPNFYIIFSAGEIEQFPLTWIASFYLADKDQNKINELLRHFPGISIIEVAAILKEIQWIINKVAIAIEVIFVFVFLSGLLILTASLSSTLAVRRYENAIIRTLGASRRQLRYYLLVEFTIIASISAVIALLMTELSSYWLYQQIFQITYHFHYSLWFVMIIASVVLINSLSLLMLNKVFSQSVSKSLAQQ